MSDLRGFSIGPLKPSASAVQKSALGPVDPVAIRAFGLERSIAETLQEGDEFVLKGPSGIETTMRVDEIQDGCIKVHPVGTATAP